MHYSELVQLYEKLNSTTKRLEKTYHVSQFIKKADDYEILFLLIEGKIFPAWENKKIGVSSKLVVKAISKATGISLTTVEDEWRKQGDLGSVAESLIKRKKQSSLLPKEVSIKYVYDSLRSLVSMEGSGSVGHKLNLISELIINSSPKEAKYIIRTILDNLRVGTGAGSLRDAMVWAFFGDEIGILYSRENNSLDIKDRQKYDELVALIQHAYDLTNDWAKVASVLSKNGKLEVLSFQPGNPVNVMLFQKAKDIEDAFKTVGKPAAFEFKYDGFRCITGYTPLFVKTKGFISVRNISEGDYILTHKGNFKKVLAINKRIIDKNEKLYKITTFYGNSFKISQGHPILVIKNGKTIWEAIEKVTLQDKVYFPIPKLSSKLPFKNSVLLTDSAGYYKKIKINNFLFRFLGYWIGEGYTNNYHNTERIGLIFNKKDKELCNYYEHNIKKSFKIKEISKNVHNDAIYLYFLDKPLREWLSNNFRREWKGKMLPEWFFSIQVRQFKEFIKGWIESDGHVDKFGRTSVTTKEKDLAMFGSLLGLKFKIMIGIKRIRVKGKDYYKLIIPKSNRGYLFSDKYVSLGIYSIREIKKNPRAILYNLQVEDDESYCTSMMSLHNCQIHKGKTIKLFTRRLEDVTLQFSDVVNSVKECVKCESCILDSEAVGYDPKTKKYVPFQKISQRIKRKYNIERMAELFPVEVNVFDIIYYNGESVINKPFNERRKILEMIIKSNPGKIVLSRLLITEDVKKAEEFVEQSYKEGQEGAMVKNLTAVYQPGARVGYGVKLKSIMEPLDLVIIAADYGEGKRSGWLSSYYLACSDNGDLKEIGKVSTGIKELEGDDTSYIEMTKLLTPLIKSAKGKYVTFKPELVIEVGYEEIQKSNKYSSGYALRFPRFLRLRNLEKSAADINSLNDVERLYKQQRGRNFKNTP